MKKIILICMLMIALIAMTGCNKQIIDMTYNFDTAIISLPNGETISGKVQSWKDYEGDQIQVKVNGITYLLHSSNVVLVDN